MNDWGARTYGEPCRGCGYSWKLPSSDARDLIAALPTTLSHDLARASGQERLPNLAWSITAYVAHVGDNLRIWAERVAGVTLGGSPAITSYDENQLAAARRYHELSLGGALWGLERAVDEWLDAIAMAPEGLTMSHPERGVIDLVEVVCSNAHDAAHHLSDIRRTLGATP
jgi:hypothetical protein